MTGPAAAPATLLRLMWLASPALPVGGFSYSEGLEAAVDAGIVTDETSAGDWLAQQLDLVVARAELPAVAQAFDAWQRADVDRVRVLNDWVHATRETAELALQATQMGRSLAQWLRNGEHAADARVAQLGALPGGPAWPIAFALAAAFTGATARDALLAFAFGWAENMAQAAIKAVPLGQAAAQRMLARTVHAIPAAADRALALPDGERRAFAPMLAILSSRHETQYSRLFRS